MTYLLLFIEFFKTGLFSIGGGLATLPFLYEMADKYPWFDRTMLADMIAISESTPGPIGVNIATYAGFHAGGLPGALVSTTALVMPSVIIIIIIAQFLKHFSENKYVQDAFYGLRPAVTALIGAAGFEVLKISILNWDFFVATRKLMNLLNIKAMILFAVLLFITIKFKRLHPLVVIALAAGAGIVFKF